MDANDIRDALRQLTDLLPSVAERMATLMAEEAVSYTHLTLPTILRV